VVNAWEEGELVMHARLWVWRMNMRTGQTSEEMLDPARNVEFPTFNSRLSGRRTRFGYLVDHSEARTLQWYGIRKYDLDTGESLGSWSDSPTHSYYSEPWFAAADNYVTEDDGYVIAFQWNEKLNRETLDIFDAKKIEDGPVAQLEVPFRVPSGFHACWMAADRMRV
jgi:carotenoid cleavage dioxygenase-like enzyme